MQLKMHVWNLPHESLHVLSLLIEIWEETGIKKYFDMRISRHAADNVNFFKCTHMFFLPIAVPVHGHLYKPNIGEQRFGRG